MRLLHALTISAAIVWSASPAAAIDVIRGGLSSAEVTVGSVEDGVARWRPPSCDCDEGGVVMLPVGSSETIDRELARFRNAPVTTIDGASVGTIVTVREASDRVLFIITIDQSFTSLVTRVALRAESARALDHGVQIQTGADDLLASIAAVIQQM